MKKFFAFILLMGLVCCKTKEPVDSIVINANVYTVNDNFEKAEAFAVKDGKFIEVGNSEVLKNKFSTNNIIDAKGQTIVPGFIDAHCHFLGLGLNQLNANLVGTTSFDEVVNRVLGFQNKYQQDFIFGRGWDQNDWKLKEFPNNTLLDSLFPDTPVALTRVDGHALLVNQAALDLGNITIDSEIDGGEVVIEEGKLTGVLIDKAQRLVLKHWPEPSRREIESALLEAQKLCVSQGLTTVDDAGLEIDSIEIIDSLQNSGDLNIRVYAMVSATKKNLDYYLDKGIIKTDKLNIRSFKFYADGALGSRGAMLRKPYTDKPGHLGLLVNSIEDLEETATRISNSEYQMNTHAIGDSANHVVLHTYKKVLQDKPDRRWRVEHAQIISPEDFNLFNDIIPSIQPTHATSDMYWAEDRVGAERIKGGYAYKDLLKTYGKVALGTDFPVEYVSPFYTFYAAVARKDLKGHPERGYQMENALSREETLKGMTIWAAYSNFEEAEKGSIEAGKFADFIILDKDIMKVDVSEIPNIKVLSTFIDGELQ
ncbi:amidohydrolase [Flavivirga spongiicola]|uniref:Amidohydrolase n=1 Tax=Flavivirga spongiicola TaxID=421621 RepID=A0ABU7XWI5_9FLAO|nr:amidohydrolase [Flavivirga sp. MEBiC05379]MDO5980122.1 amidohydrolase [Flavivirga sp. MEBiC05379]